MTDSEREAERRMRDIMDSIKDDKGTITEIRRVVGERECKIVHAALRAYAATFESVAAYVGINAGDLFGFALHEIKDLADVFGHASGEHKPSKG